MLWVEMKRDWCLHWTLPVAQAQNSRIVHCYHLNNEHCAASLNVIDGKGQPTVVACAVCRNKSLIARAGSLRTLNGLVIISHR